MGERGCSNSQGWGFGVGSRDGHIYTQVSYSAASLTQASSMVAAHERIVLFPWEKAVAEVIMVNGGMSGWVDRWCGYIYPSCSAIKMEGHRWHLREGCRGWEWWAFWRC